MSNLNAKFQASLTQIEWELWIRSSTVKWEFPSRLVIGTHGTRTVTWKKNHGWNSRVPWKLTVKRHLRIHSNLKNLSTPHQCLIPDFYLVFRRISPRSLKIPDTFLIWAKLKEEIDFLVCMDRRFNCRKGEKKGCKPDLTTSIQ
jgi:hypothetical protein